MGNANLENININMSPNRKRKNIINMFLFLSGRGVSLFGSRIYSWALALYILNTTGSGTGYSVNILLSTLPLVLLSPISGVLSDRVSRKKMVVGMDILSGIVVLSLFALSAFDSLRVSYIYVTTLLLSICNTFFDVPFNAAIPNIVDNKYISKINSMNQLVTSLSSIGAPFIGGLLFAFIDIRVFLVVNGISFIISGITEMFINFKFNSSSSEKKSEVKEKKSFSFIDAIEDFKDGFRFLRSKTYIYILVMFIVVLNFFIMFGIGVPYAFILNNVVGLSPKQIGILQGIQPLGMFVASLLYTILPERKKNLKQVVISLSIVNIAIILIGLSIVPQFMVSSKIAYFIVYIVIMFTVGMGLVFASIPINVTVQKNTPDEVRGRVMALMNMLCGSAIPLGIVLSGVLLDRIPTFILPVSSGVILLIITISMAFNKDLKEF